MASAPRMSLVRLWRNQILAGYTVKEIAQGSGKGYSETTIRNYTKAERAKVKERKKDFEHRVDESKALKQALGGG